MSYGNLLENGVLAQKYLPISYGEGTLVAGSLAVPLPSLGVDDVVLVQHAGPSAVTDGVLSVEKNTGVGFSVQSTNAADVGIFKWVRFAL